MLITLMLFIALAALALLAVLPDIGQQIKRNREEEMQHRGTSYMRAIQHFYRKFGRYPTRLEELENTNNLRFLRKRYKDPLNRDPETGKERDFKLLHPQDITLNNGPVLGLGGGLPGQPGAGGLPGQAGLAGALGQTGLGQAGQAGLAQAVLGQTGLGQTGLAQLAGQQPSGQNLNQKDDEDDSAASPNGQANPNSPSSPSPSSPAGTSGLSGQVFGGGPIVGVASQSKATSIREYNKKNHYNDWLFIYDQSSDRGGLLIGPWQMPPTNSIPGATPAGQQPGTGFGSQPGSGPGGSQPFGGQPQNPAPAPTPQSPAQNPPQP